MNRRDINKSRKLCLFINLIYLNVILGFFASLHTHKYCLCKHLIKKRVNPFTCLFSPNNKRLVVNRGESKSSMAVSINHIFYNTQKHTVPQKEDRHPATNSLNHYFIVAGVDLI